MNTEISVHCIAKTCLDRSAVYRWMQTLGCAAEFDVPNVPGMHYAYDAELYDGTDADAVVTLAGKRCYNSYVPNLNPNVKKVRTSLIDFVNNILTTGHGSVVEHVNYTFAIENCTRVFTAEMNRHRAGNAISEASLRYIRFEGDIPYWLPPSLQPDANNDEQHELRKKITRDAFAKVFAFIGTEYNRLVREVWEIDKMSNFAEKKIITSMLRRIIPLGVSVGAVYTLNIRALRHVLTMRCSPHAEEEICYVCGLILKHMRDAEPHLFGDFELIDGYWQPKHVKI